MLFSFHKFILLNHLIELISENHYWCIIARILQNTPEPLTKPFRGLFVWNNRHVNLPNILSVVGPWSVHTEKYGCRFISHIYVLLHFITL